MSQVLSNHSKEESYRYFKSFEIIWNLKTFILLKMEVLILAFQVYKSIMLTYVKILYNTLLKSPVEQICIIPFSGCCF